MKYPTKDYIREVALRDNVDDRIKGINKLILMTRLQEAKGFNHGNEEWSNNMEMGEIESINPLEDYCHRLEKEIEVLR